MYVPLLGSRPIYWTKTGSSLLGFKHGLHSTVLILVIARYFSEQLVWVKLRLRTSVIYK